MKIPKELKKSGYRGERKTVLMSVRVTKEDKDFIDKNDVSPTALFNWALNEIKLK